ncbi:hypothetical protein BJ170DRAFT_93593 [Xylariales sp. AK1849]|nr:hypothetical protein BJ170DRAFT_93593 [Xylariales sp. AK1849]
MAHQHMAGPLPVQPTIPNFMVARNSEMSTRIPCAPAKFAAYDLLSSSTQRAPSPRQLSASWAHSTSPGHLSAGYNNHSGKVLSPRSTFGNFPRPASRTWNPRSGARGHLRYRGLRDPISPPDETHHSSSSSDTLKPTRPPSTEGNHNGHDSRKRKRDSSLDSDEPRYKVGVAQDLRLDQPRPRRFHDIVIQSHSADLDHSLVPTSTNHLHVSAIQPLETRSLTLSNTVSFEDQCAEIKQLLDRMCTPTPYLSAVCNGNRHSHDYGNGHGYGC